MDAGLGHSGKLSMGKAITLFEPGNAPVVEANDIKNIGEKIRTYLMDSDRNGHPWKGSA
jgi:hypothetical protein